MSDGAGSGLQICFCDLRGRPYADLDAHDLGCLEHDRAAAVAWHVAAEPWTPLRNPPKRQAPQPPNLPNGCYLSEYGFSVHVRPGCRCRTARGSGTQVARHPPEGTTGHLGRKAGASFRRPV